MGVNKRNRILKVHQLTPGVTYDIVNNKFHNHIYYCVDNDGFLYVKDVIMNATYKSTDSYNAVSKMRFKEVD